MPSSIDVEERFGSRRNTGGAIEFLYWAKGSDDEIAIRAAVLDTAPAQYDGIDIEGITEIEQQGNELWFATVNYPGGGNAFSVEPKQSFEFDTTTGTENILTALGARERYDGSNDAPDFGNAINVDSDGTVNGVEIGVKVLDFSITIKVPIDDIDADYLQTLYDLSWHYNKDDPIAITLLPGLTVTFPAGTILYKGARGGAQEGELVSITFLLSFSPNFQAGSGGPEGITDIDGIPIPDKLGWQYMWVYRTPAVLSGDGGKKWMGPKARAIYVDDVYYPADLSALNIS